MKNDAVDGHVNRDMPTGMIAGVGEEDEVMRSAVYLKFAGLFLKPCTLLDNGLLPQCTVNKQETIATPP